MNETVSTSGISPYRLYTRMMPVLGVAAVIASFAEADQRGLLFKASDSAFFVEDAALAVPNGGTTLYLANQNRPRSGPRLRNISGRPAPRIGSAPILGTADDVTGPGGGASRVIGDGPASLQQPTAIAATAPPGTGTTTTRNPSSPGPGFPDSPIGLIAVNTSNPGPVVPAVPEPASWLLMILGVGWLGLTLRRRTRPVLTGSERHLLTA